MMANDLSCHSLQNGHWKSLISTSHTGAVAAPRMRALSAMVLMESAKLVAPATATSPADEPTLAAVAGDPAAEDAVAEDVVAGDASAARGDSDCEQAVASSRARAASGPARRARGYCSMIGEEEGIDDA